jgi:hypothetical protein
MLGRGDRRTMNWKGFRTYQRNVMSPSSRQKSKPSKEISRVVCLLLVCLAFSLDQRMGSVLFSFIFLLLFVGWNETEFTWNIAHYWVYCTNPWMMNMTTDEHEAVIGMKTGRENQSTWRKPAPIPFCSP